MVFSDARLRPKAPGESGPPSEMARHEVVTLGVGPGAIVPFPSRSGQGCPLEEPTWQSGKNCLKVAFAGCSIHKGGAYGSTEKPDLWELSSLPSGGIKYLHRLAPAQSTLQSHCCCLAESKPGDRPRSQVKLTAPRCQIDRLSSQLSLPYCGISPCESPFSQGDLAAGHLLSRPVIPVCLVQSWPTPALNKHKQRTTEMGLNTTPFSSRP